MMRSTNEIAKPPNPPEGYLLILKINIPNCAIMLIRRLPIHRATLKATPKNDKEAEDVCASFIPSCKHVYWPTFARL